MNNTELIHVLGVFFGIIAIILGFYSIGVCLASIKEMANIWVLWSAIPASWLCFLTGHISCRLLDD